MHVNLTIQIASSVEKPHNVSDGVNCQFQVNITLIHSNQPI